jgi:hypothetical protein
MFIWLETVVEAAEVRLEAKELTRGQVVGGKKMWQQQHTHTTRGKGQVKNKGLVSCVKKKN